MIKLKVELQIGGETTKSKAPGPIIMIDKSKTATVLVQIIFTTLFWGRC